jgi:hypothetical protein
MHAGFVGGLTAQLHSMGNVNMSCVYPMKRHTHALHCTLSHHTHYLVVLCVDPALDRAHIALHCTLSPRSLVSLVWCHWCGVTGVHITGVVWVVCNCRYLIVTTGNAGGSCYDDWGPRPGPPGFRDCEKEELTFTRRREMVAAAEYVGIPRSQVSGDSQVL